MKHIMFEGTDWRWDTEKFPRYVVELTFGRHCHDMAMLPVMGGLTPSSAGAPVLPEGAFKVIKTKEKGTILIVLGADNTNRVLLMAGASGGFRGSVALDKQATTGTVLAYALAGNACESRAEVAAILEPGQQLIFNGDGRDGSFIVCFRFDGTTVERKRFTMEEWGFVNSPNNDSEEVL